MVRLLANPSVNQTPGKLRLPVPFTDHNAARKAGMTALHRMWFGMPVAQHVTLLPGFAPTGRIVVSATDMARYLQMILAEGNGPSGRLLSRLGVRQLLTPASPPSRSRLLSSDFEFRYGEGWFVRRFGAAAEARWHLGSLPSFAAWMVLLPETKQAVVLLINTNSESPLGEVSAVMSRLSIGVVNLLRGQSVPKGPSLREAYWRFNVVTILVAAVLVALAWWAACTRRAVWSVLMALTAIAMLVVLQILGLNGAILSAFAPDSHCLLPWRLRCCACPRHGVPGHRRAGPCCATVAFGSHEA